MASFNVNVNLMGYKGAKVMNIIDEVGGKSLQRPYVCIPVDLNDIQVAWDSRSNQASSANAKVRLDQLRDPEAYVSKKNAERSRVGDKLMTIDEAPSHFVKGQVSHAFIKKQVARYGMRLVQKALLGKEKKDMTPEELDARWKYLSNPNYLGKYGVANIDDTKLLDLANADDWNTVVSFISTMMETKLGVSYVIHSNKQQQPVSAGQYGQAVTGQAYDPTQQADDSFPPETDQDGNPVDDDELPF